MQTINTKYYGPISFEKTWVSSDGRHIGKLTKGGYAHLSGSIITNEQDLMDLIPSVKERDAAIKWFKQKDEPNEQIAAKSLLLRSDGSYLWEDGTEVTDVTEVYNALPKGPQLEAVLVWFRAKSAKEEAAQATEDDKKKKEAQARMAHAREAIKKKAA